MNWYLKVLNQYSDFNSRARRKEYWMFALVNFIISMLIVGVDNALGFSFNYSGNVSGSGVFNFIQPFNFNPEPCCCRQATA